MGTPARPVIRSLSKALMISWAKTKLISDDRAALLKGGHQLIHARVKAERQHRQDSFLLGDAQVGRDDRCCPP